MSFALLSECYSICHHCIWLNTVIIGLFNNGFDFYCVVNVICVKDTSRPYNIFEVASSNRVADRKKRPNKYEHFSPLVNKVMENTNKINVFNEFKPYLRFLKVYNHQNSHSRDWRSTLRRIFDALCTTLVILLTVCFALLTTWCLCENEVNLDKIVVAAPVIATISQIAFFGISLVLKSETMDGMIRRIQAMVDRRKYFVYFCTANWCF